MGSDDCEDITNDSVGADTLIILAVSIHSSLGNISTHGGAPTFSQSWANRISFCVETPTIHFVQSVRTRVIVWHLTSLHQISLPHQSVLPLFQDNTLLCWGFICWKWRQNERCALVQRATKLMKHPETSLRTDLRLPQTTAQLRPVLLVVCGKFLWHPFGNIWRRYSSSKIQSTEWKGTASLTHLHRNMMHSNVTLLAWPFAIRITPNFHYLDNTDERLAPFLSLSREVWKFSVLNIEISALVCLYFDATFRVSSKE